MHFQAPQTEAAQLRAAGAEAGPWAGRGPNRQPGQEPRGRVRAAHPVRRRPDASAAAAAGTKGFDQGPVEGGRVASWAAGTQGLLQGGAWEEREKRCTI